MKPSPLHLLVLSLSLVLPAQAQRRYRERHAPIPAPHPTDPPPEVPETPSRPDVSSALRGVGSAVRACGTGSGGSTIVLTVSFASDGHVTRVDVQPPHEGTAVGDCAARAALEARLPPFRRPAFVVRFPFALQ